MKITFKDKVFDLTPADVEKKMSQVTPEPDSKYFKYFLKINKQEYPIKQVIGKVFSLAKPEFTSEEAYRVLANLGFKIVERS